MFSRKIFLNKGLAGLGHSTLQPYVKQNKPCFQWLWWG